jgi:hypothetical protein
MKNMPLKLKFALIPAEKVNLKKLIAKIPIEDKYPDIPKEVMKHYDIIYITTKFYSPLFRDCTRRELNFMYRQALGHMMAAIYKKLREYDYIFPEVYATRINEPFNEVFMLYSLVPKGLKVGNSNETQKPPNISK